MGLWTLLQGFLLLANAFAVLNEDRFLGPRGWTLLQIQGGKTTLKGQIIGFIHACQYFRLPLIVLNIITIAVKLISGEVRSLLFLPCSSATSLCKILSGRHILDSNIHVEYSRPSDQKLPKDSDPARFSA
ncbi:unnamed protein product [Prunus brigantina]